MNIKGDLIVSRTVGMKRGNETLNSESLSTSRVITVNDYYFLNLTPSTTGTDATLPDATTLENGWRIKLRNGDVTNSYDVKNNGATILQTIGIGLAYEFILLDNSTSDGVWEIMAMQMGAAEAIKYVVNFSSSDFPAAVGGYRTLTGTQIAGLLAANHGSGVNPMFRVQEGAGPYDWTLCDKEEASTIGDISLRVTDGAQFSGRVIVV